MRPPPPADALLVIDVGNTRVGIATWDAADGVHATRRVSSSEPGEWAPALRAVWDQSRAAGRRAVVLSSVAPRVALQVADAVREVSGIEPLRLREDIPLPLPLAVDRPEEVGLDRICAAAAAYDRVRGACAIASFGTAITIDCVSPDGRFLGGAILPGLEMSLAALNTGTAQLPRVELAPPTGPFGRSTAAAMLNGVVYGAVGALRELVERYATEIREWPHLVLTGGNAAIIRELVDYADSVVPDLTLMGIALAYHKASGAA